MEPFRNLLLLLRHPYQALGGVSALRLFVSGILARLDSGISTSWLQVLKRLYGS